MALDAATETLVLTPEIWSQQLTDYAYAKAVIANRVHRVDSEITAMGGKINLPIMPTMTVADVTATSGACTDQDYTYTEVELTVNQWRVNVINLVRKASIQANRDIIADFKRQAPDSLMADVDNQLFALYGDLSTNTQGDTNTLPSEDLLTAAVSNLLDVNLGERLRDPSQVTFAFHTNLWKYLKKIEGYSSAAMTGESVGGGLKMSLPNIYGIPVVLSSLIDNSSGRKNMLLMKECLALGVQRGIEVEVIPAESLSTKIAAHILFGVKTYNEARGVCITTVTS